MRNIIQAENCDVMIEVDYRDGCPGWITIACFGSKGIFIDDDEWDAFVKLVAEADAMVKTGRKI